MEYIEDFLYQAFTRNTRGALYFVTFLLSLHVFLVIYINSNYLSTFLPEQYVGLAYILGACGGFLALSITPLLFTKWGTIRTLKCLLVLEFLTFIGLAVTENVVVAVALFIVYSAIPLIVFLILDILIEARTENENVTGNVRGTVLAVGTIALILSPMLTGFILSGNHYERVFLISALLLIPVFFIIHRTFKNEPNRTYISLHPRLLVSCISKAPAITHIFKAHFIMQLFFAWMVIYIPLYLHEHIKLPWEVIGFIFTIMVLPYLLEFPIGKIADRWLGEKEMLSLGFIITGLSVGTIPFIESNSVFIWAGILFMTRLGAAFLESMTEIYFFRHVNSADSNTINGFRMLRPLGYGIGALIGILSLLIIDIQYIFIVFSIIILFGLRYSLTIKDTR